ncbi:MAG TPA: TonB family protein [Candidatus Acidoferrum sp.]|jgi:TonB family protein|nr:TonB family protein [Candidatus Acidoferrum sp.]
MGYQALLFCPDEKTARTVTQVLSELDFTVVPCTEPFATVKKLMGEHFDAVVVDCDNEQNATLLFKSARNTPDNQSSLAVAVVEGQAGVAKAFRIGANLVLTKPINVEQAKGTLRVARGLLRKNEGAKPLAGAASTAVKTATAAAPAAKPAPQRPIPTSATEPKVAASVRIESPEADADLFEVSDERSSGSITKPAAQASVPVITSTAAAETRSETATSQPASSAGFGASAASAPAPAREPKPSVSTGHKPSTVITEPDSTIEKVAVPGFSSPVGSPVEEISEPAPFTFGGNVGSEAKSTSGASKKAILAVAVIVVLAASGYAAWTQWGRPSGTASVPAHATAQPVTAPSAVPQGTPNAVPATTPSSFAPSSSASASSSASSIQAPVPEPASATRSSGTVKTSSDTRSTASAENAAGRPNKVSVDADSSKPSASSVAVNKAPATKADASPIVIKGGISKPAATTDAPVPSVIGIAPADNATMPNLGGSPSKAPTPVLQTLAVSQGVSQGLLLKKVQPNYPANALQMRIEGAVQLMATISRNGDISAVKVLSGEPQLANAAVSAVKQWKYKPYLLNGAPVEIQTQITVNFKVPH